MATSHVSWPVITLGAVAAAIGLAYVLRKPSGASPAAVATTPVHGPQDFFTPPLAPAATTSSSSSFAQDANDQHMVNDVLASLQEQAAPSVQKAIADALAQTPLPPEAKAVASSLPGIPIPLPPIDFGF